MVTSLNKFLQPTAVAVIQSFFSGLSCAGSGKLSHFLPWRRLQTRQANTDGLQWINELLSCHGSCAVQIFALCEILSQYLFVSYVYLEPPNCIKTNINGVRCRVSYVCVSECGILTSSSVNPKWLCVQWQCCQFWLSWKRRLCRP